MADPVIRGRDRRILAVNWTLWLVLFAAVVIVLVRQGRLDTRQDKAVRVASDHVCQVEAVLISKIEKDIANSRMFLRDHPHGIPGIPRALILRGIAANRAQIVALTDPACNERST